MNDTLQKERELMAVAALEAIEDEMSDVEPFLSDATASKMWQMIQRAWDEINERKA